MSRSKAAKSRNACYVIKHLAEEGPKSAYDLSRPIHVSPDDDREHRPAYSSIYGAFRLLEKDGYIERYKREKSEKGGERVTYWLTYDGAIFASSLKVDRSKLLDWWDSLVEGNVSLRALALVLYLDRELGVEDAPAIIEALVKTSTIGNTPRILGPLSKGLEVTPNMKAKVLGGLEKLVAALKEQA